MKIEISGYDSSGIIISLSEDSNDLIIESAQDSDTYFYSVVSLKEVEAAINFLKLNGQAN